MFGKIFTVNDTVCDFTPQGDYVSFFEHSLLDGGQEARRVSFEAPVDNRLKSLALWNAISITRNLQQIRRRLTSTNSTGGERFETLDGLRAVAFVWVALFHVQRQGIALNQAPLWVSALVAHGNGGVTLFLVLSGFLLTHVMLAELTVTRTAWQAYSRFICRRLARVYPSLLIGVLVVQAVVSEMRGQRWWTACGQPKEALPVFVFIHVGGLLHPVLKHALLVGNYDFQNA